MKIGDIYSVKFPPSNGHEQYGIRPAIIVQSPAYETKLPTTLIIPLTTKLRAQQFPGTFLIQPDQDNKLNSPSVALVFQLRAIDNRRLGQQIGRLTPNYLAQLSHHLGDILPFRHSNPV